MTLQGSLLAFAAHIERGLALQGEDRIEHLMTGLHTLCKAKERSVPLVAERINTLSATFTTSLFAPKFDLVKHGPYFAGEAREIAQLALAA